MRERMRMVPKCAHVREDQCVQSYTIATKLMTVEYVTEKGYSINTSSDTSSDSYRTKNRTKNRTIDTSIE
jgi:hypothetical protein